MPVMAAKRAWTSWKIVLAKSAAIAIIKQVRCPPRFWSHQVSVGECHARPFLSALRAPSVFDCLVGCIARGPRTSRRRGACSWSRARGVQPAERQGWQLVGSEDVERRARAGGGRPRARDPRDEGAL